MEQERSEVSEFLVDNGFTHLVEKFSDVRTMVALAALDENDLVELLDISKPAARVIYKKIQVNSSSIPSAGGVNGASSSLAGAGQLIAVPPETQLAIAGMKNQWELEKQALLHEMEMNKLKGEYDNKLSTSKTEAQFSQLSQMIESNQKVSQLQRQIDEEKMKGRLDVMEAEKNALQARLTEEKKTLIRQTELLRSHPPYTMMPSWWNSSIFGVFNPIPSLYPGDSNLLNVLYFQVIQSWLPSPRNWVLLYRGSRDGFSSSKFHALCNNLGATVTVVRSSSGYVFGGYNPNNWSSSQSYQGGSNSFLFTLHNQWSHPPTKFAWMQSNGPYDNSTYGPTFGGGHDLYICNACNSNNSSSSFPSSYDDVIGHGSNTFAGSSSFTVTELEVFRVF